MENVFEKTGIPSAEMIAEKFPPMARIKKSRVALAECYKNIPCNPCETACPQHAITVGTDINNIPKIDFDKCTGCGICLSKCPGLAIMLVDASADDKTVELSIPHEFLPLPEVGAKVDVLSREGEKLTEGTVTAVLNPKSFDRTPIVRFTVGVEFLYTARAIRVR